MASTGNSGNAVSLSSAGKYDSFMDFMAKRKGAMSGGFDANAKPVNVTGVNIDVMFVSRTPGKHGSQQNILFMCMLGGGPSAQLLVRKAKDKGAEGADQAQRQQQGKSSGSQGGFSPASALVPRGGEGQRGKAFPASSSGSSAGEQVMTLTAGSGYKFSTSHTLVEDCRCGDLITLIDVRANEYVKEQGAQPVVYLNVSKITRHASCRYEMGAILKAVGAGRGEFFAPETVRVKELEDKKWVDETGAPTQRFGDQVKILAMEPLSQDLLEAEDGVYFDSQWMTGTQDWQFLSDPKKKDSDLSIGMRIYATGYKWRGKFEKPEADNVDSFLVTASAYKPDLRDFCIENPGPWFSIMSVMAYHLSFHVIARVDRSRTQSMVVNTDRGNPANPFSFALALGVEGIYANTAELYSRVGIPVTEAYARQNEGSYCYDKAAWQHEKGERVVCVSEGKGRMSHAAGIEGVKYFALTNCPLDASDMEVLLAMTPEEGDFALRCATARAGQTSQQQPKIRLKAAGGLVVYVFAILPADPQVQERAKKTVAKFLSACVDRGFGSAGGNQDQDQAHKAPKLLPAPAAAPEAARLALPDPSNSTQRAGGGAEDEEDEEDLGAALSGAQPADEAPKSRTLSTPQKQAPTEEDSKKRKMQDKSRPQNGDSGSEGSSKKRF